MFLRYEYFSIQVPAKKAALDSTDVFILDKGLTLFQWNGKTCNKDEKFKAVQYLQTIKSERGKATVETLDEIDTVSLQAYNRKDFGVRKSVEIWQFSPKLFYLNFIE